MTEFFTVVLIVFAAVWGSVFLGVIAKKFAQGIEDGSAQDPRIDDLRDEVALLSARLGQVEEEVGFYRQLHGGSSQRIEAGGPRREVSDASPADPAEDNTSQVDGR